MTEKLFQFIWQFQYFNQDSLQTASGEPIRILQPGQPNKNQGPDFEQARITINGTTWAGNVELHLRSSDWLKHGHQGDDRYNKVILHVVWLDDMPVLNKEGHPFPALELRSRVSNLLLESYDRWMQADNQVPCSNSISAVPGITWELWKQRLLVERLMEKYEVISHHLAKTNNHWEEVFWIMLCRYFGGHINGISFEQIAVSLPVQLLAKHKNQIHQLEALLFGQAGLLHKNFEEAYPKMLYNEYQFLQKKYRLRVVNLPPSFLRMRPVNFPSVRLAQLAALVQNSSHLFSAVREASSVNVARTLFEVTANDYWHYHFKFDEQGSFLPKNLGCQMIDTLLINTVSPVLFAYGNFMNDAALKEKALVWLEKIAAEKNSLIAPFVALQVKPKHAADSQALLQLKKEYCDAKRCLECAIGNAILKRS